MSNALQVADLDLDGLTAREWLVSNGIGGYASSTLAGMNTRRYHGLLVAALNPPLGRTLLLAKLTERLWHDGRWVPYESGEDAPFVGSLDACLKEIEHDRWGCFWG